MNTIEKLKNDIAIARKEKNTNKLSLLTTLLSEISMIGKNKGNRETTNDEATAVVKKFIKGCQETIVFCEKLNKDASKAKEELALFEQYIEKQMTVEELETVIKDIFKEFDIKEKKQMGQVMKTLKERHNGLYDGKVASDIINNLFK